MLVAGSALCRKTTSINIGCELLYDLEGIDVIDGKLSAEKFLFRFQHTSVNGSKAPTIFVKADEVSVMLSSDQQGDRLMDYLTKIFDCPREVQYDTFKHGQVIIKEPYCTILCGTQPDRLSKVLPDMAFGGGFFSRIITVYQEDTNREPTDFYVISEREKQLFYEMKLHLDKLLKLAPAPFTISKEAMEYYFAWRKTIEKPDDKRLDGFVGRQHDHVLTTSMLLAGCDDTKPLHIELGHLEAGVKSIDHILKVMPFALEGAGSQMPDKNVADRVLRILQTVKTISHSDLLKKLYGHCNAIMLRAVMETLIEAGFVRRDLQKPHIYWIVEKKL